MRNDDVHVIFGAGQIGPRLARRLLASGKKVRIVRRSEKKVGVPGVEVVVGADRLAELLTVEALEVAVEHGHGERLALAGGLADLAQRFGTVLGAIHHAAPRGEHVGEELDVVRGIVHHQDASGIVHDLARSSWTASRKAFTLMGLLW